jgi:hypothetical protein
LGYRATRKNKELEGVGQGLVRIGIIITVNLAQFCCLSFIVWELLELVYPKKGSNPSTNAELSTGLAASGLDRLFAERLRLDDLIFLLTFSLFSLKF